MIKKLFKKNRATPESFQEELLKLDLNENTLKQMLYKDQLDIDHINSKGETFLHTSLKENRIEASLWLISNNISLNIKDKEGKIPFDIAMEHKNHRVVKLILEVSDVDIDKQDKFGRTLLQDSIVLGDHEMAKILIEHGADINSLDNKNRNIVYDALSYGHEEFITYLLSLENLELNNIDTEQNSIMHHNLVKDNDKLAMKLLEAGADPTIKDKNGKTFLCNSALRGMEGMDVVSTAIKKGCNLNSRVAHENSILMELISAASKLKYEEQDRRKSLFKMSHELVFKGIDINALNDNGENALFRAVRAGDVDQVSFLLGSRIEVNVQSNDGETPLSYAVYGGVEKLDIILLLLKYNADPTIPNKERKSLYEVLNEIVLHFHGNKELENKTLLKHLKKDGQYIRVLKELLDNNERDLDFLDSVGNPLFFTPLLYNNIPLFKFYIKAGLDIHSLNGNGFNLFFEYVMKVFEDGNEDIDFETPLSMLISARIGHNTQDETGWTVVSKVIGTTTCNINLFKSLVKIVRFDYSIVDKLGRTAVHTAVWSSNVNVIKIINYIDPKIKDLPDNYGISPIVYAALLGDRKLVTLFIDLKTNLTNNKSISKAAINKYAPLLKNLEKLTHNVEDPNMLKNIKNVIVHVTNSFGITNID